MRIENVTVRVFIHKTKTMHDTDGHAHPGPEREARQALFTVVADDGTEGYAFGSPEGLRKHVIDGYVKKVLVGQDPFDREKLWQGLARWQRGSGGSLTDRTLALVDLALWDLAGRKLNM